MDSLNHSLDMDNAHTHSHAKENKLLTQRAALKDDDGILKDNNDFPVNIRNHVYVHKLSSYCCTSV